MKKFLLILSAVALFASCDKDDDSTSKESNSFSITKQGEDAVSISDVSAVFYTGDNTLVINGFSFTANLAATATGRTSLPIVDLEYDGSDISITSTTAYYEFMGMAASSAISDLSGEINGSKVSFDFTINSATGGGSGTDYKCSYDGAIEIVTDSYEGLWAGDNSISDVNVTYYKEDNTLLIEDFRYADRMTVKADFALGSLTATTTSNITTISTESIDDVTYTLTDSKDSPTVNVSCTDDVSNITAVIYDNDGYGRFEFDIDITYGNYGLWTITYIGEIAINNGSYTVD